ncbi:MAG TPA: 2,3,4,5-tetrahydropyridine-2,6-dicarboxylate N-succinyltransferase [Bacteroidota bacterium]|nr:2,3,4,5-tetrahydropyridine-2,6-dicarboxylate N-succinyltransferase [Bacteroidota bacterium]
MTLNLETLPTVLEELTSARTSGRKEREEEVFEYFISLLDGGKVRAAERLGGRWVVHEWVKKGILLGFRLGRLENVEAAQPFTFFDKHTYPLKSLRAENDVRLVPGGSSVRRGAYLAPGVIMMPPSYVNVGAYVDGGTLIDSHALVGSCAQVGKRVHLSAAAQIGGVLEPVNALPVIVEDDVLVGGNCGIYEGTIVGTRAVIAAGVVITASTPVYDCVNGTILRKSEGGSLVIPENAVVVSGSRAMKNEFATAHGLSMYTPLIVKYRDSKTDARTALEDLLRSPVG